MGNGSVGMQYLCEEIIASYGQRKIALAYLKDEADVLRGDVRLFIGQYRILHNQQAKALRRELAEYRRVLGERVQAFREESQGRKQKLRADRQGAGRTWRAMAAAIKQRRARIGPPDVNGSSVVTGSHQP